MLQIPIFLVKISSIYLTETTRIKTSKQFGIASFIYKTSRQRTHNIIGDFTLKQIKHHFLVPTVIQRKKRATKSHRIHLQLNHQESGASKQPLLLPIFQPLLLLCRTPRGTPCLVLVWNPPRLLLLTIPCLVHWKQQKPPVCFRSSFFLCAFFFLSF